MLWPGEPSAGRGLAKPASDALRRYEALRVKGTPGGHDHAAARRSRAGIKLLSGGRQADLPYCCWLNTMKKPEAARDGGRTRHPTRGRKT